MLNNLERWSLVEADASDQDEKRVVENRMALKDRGELDAAAVIEALGLVRPLDGAGQPALSGAGFDEHAKTHGLRETVYRHEFDQVSDFTYETEVGQAARPCSIGHTKRVGSERRSLRPAYATLEGRKFQIQTHVWKTSRLPQATHMVTIDFPMEELRLHCAAGGTVAGFFVNLQKRVQQIFRRENALRYFVWTIEVDGGTYHVHILEHFPNETILRRVIRSLAKALGVIFPSRQDLLVAAMQDNSGHLLHVKPANDNTPYSRTGRCGVEGLIDYIGKSLDRTSSRKAGLRIGKCAGASQTITSRIRKPRTSGYQWISYEADHGND